MDRIRENVSENLSVEVIPDEQHEFLMSTNEVAKGYGVSSGTIRTHKLEHKEELVEGKHFITVINDRTGIRKTGSSVGKTNADCKSGNYQLRQLPSASNKDTSVTKSNADCKSGGYQFRQVLWTKRGIVRLGFFVKSERARLFRDWAEDLVITKIEEAQRTVEKSRQLSLWPEPPKRNHNRLTKERLVDILADVAKIDDKELRLSLIDKLTNIKQ